MTYQVILAARARRALPEELPEVVAAVVHRIREELIVVEVIDIKHRRDVHRR